jgi:hypothetical protein
VFGAWGGFARNPRDERGESRRRDTALKRNAHPTRSPRDLSRCPRIQTKRGGLTGGEGPHHSGGAMASVGLEEGSRASCDRASQTVGGPLPEMPGSTGCTPARGRALQLTGHSPTRKSSPQVASTPRAPRRGESSAFTDRRSPLRQSRVASAGRHGDRAFSRRTRPDSEPHP